MSHSGNHLHAHHHDQKEQMEKYERRYSDVLENVTLASIVLDDKFKLSFANDYFLSLVGREREDVIDKDFVEMFIPSDKREKVRNVYDLVSMGVVEVKPYEETQILTKDERIVTFGFNNTTVKNSEGEFGGIASVGKDLPQEQDIQATAEKVHCSNHQHKHDNGNHVHDATCELLKDYDTTHDGSAVTGDVLGDLVLVKVLKNLGSDKGNVQLAVNKTTKEKVAVKTMTKELMKPEEIERARREIDIMQQLTKLQNPYIIKLIGFEETATHFNLVIEYLSGGELVALILKNNGLSEGHVHRLFKQILCAIETCHQNSIVHRDIKLQNILLDDQNNIKLIDFGLSNFVEEGTFRNTFCGTPAYAPPEILLGTSYKGPEVDIWSLGVVLYSMLTSEFPFTTIGEILKGVFKEPAGISSECLDLLRRTLTVKKELRATLQDVLNHPWILKEEAEFVTKEDCCDDCSTEPLAKKIKIDHVSNVQI